MKVMKFKVAYGCGEQEVEVPDSCTVEVLEGSEGEGRDEAEVIREAIENPMDAPPLKEFLKGGKVLIFVNDGSRPTPTVKMFDVIIDMIKDRPDTKIVIGCGTHKPPTDEDYEFIFGEHYKTLKDNIYYHAAKDKDNLMSYGKTPMGNEVEMNKLVGWADKLLLTGSVEPHYFAGFTGGRKWVIGVGGFWTIERNHHRALKDEAKTLALEGNPVHDELMAWDRMVDKPKWCLNVVQDRHLKAAACFCGNIDRVFEEAVKAGLEIYTAETKGNADIVLTVSKAPQDSNLYQALKAQEHGKLAMKKGAILILVAECRRGLGPSHFGAMLKGKSAEDVLQDIETQFHLGHHKIAKLLNTMMKGQVWAVTDLDAGDVASVQMTKFATVQEALDKGLEAMGKDARIIFLPDGGMTVPKVVQ
jgi:nickel-dependent lactate racemase